jgi:biotin carboxyl carrier protein
MVTSPAVGYFQPAEGLDVGRNVRGGDVLGHVDVLGIRHDVVASADGVLGRVVVEAGEAVEYGQELIRVDGSPTRPEAS